MTPTVLVKVFSKEVYARAFMDHTEMQFTTFEKFREYDNDGSGRFDDKDGLCRVIIDIPEDYKQGEQLQVTSTQTMTLKEDLGDVTSGNAKLSVSYYTRGMIYSTFLLENDKISNDQYQAMKKLGDYCVVFNATKLLPILEKLMAKDYYNFECARVNYSDDKLDFSTPINIYTKDKKYEYQNEFRICVLPKLDTNDFKHYIARFYGLQKKWKLFYNLDKFVEQFNKYGFINLINKIS